MSKPYGLYFGSCDHIRSGWCSKCSYDVIMCGGPLGGAPSIGVLCSVYKARCCRSSGLGKKGNVTQTQENQGHTTVIPR